MSDVQKKWEDSSWGRKLLVKKRRASLNDFDRFKLMLAKIKVSDSWGSLYFLLYILFTFFVLISARKSCEPLWMSIEIWLYHLKETFIVSLFLLRAWFVATHCLQWTLSFCRELDWSGRSLQSWKRVNLRKRISLASNFVREQFIGCGLLSLLFLKPLRLGGVSEVHGILDIKCSGFFPMCQH